MFNLRRLQHNLALKLGALAIALLLWSHVKTERKYETIVEFPLVVSEASGRFVVANELPPTVSVNVVGVGKDLIFRDHHGRVVLRPRISRREAITVDLNMQNIEGVDPSEGIEPISIESPRSLVLDFDYLDTREVAVAPRVDLQLEPGHTLVGQMTVNPAKVRIGGPRQYVRRTDSVATDSISLRGVKQSFTRTVSLRPTSGWNLTVTPEEVTINAEVQVLLERRFREVPVVVTHIPRGVTARAEPDIVAVDIVGGERLINDLSEDDIKVTIDYRKRFEIGLDDLPLTVTLPEQTRLLRVSPPTVSILIETGSHR
ncbi:MAG TPA: YbbR-like domain-containing protein [Firmicutes bacterium]|nr:YbbR-like domain-containing protein [Bacillota bacterium]